MTDETRDAGWLAGYDAGASGRFPRPAVNVSSESEADAFRRWLRSLDQKPVVRPRGPPVTTPAELEATERRFRSTHPVAAYVELDGAPAPPAVYGAIRAELADNPLRGVTRGELELEAMRREAAAAPAAEGALVVDTELRETLEKIDGYEQRFSERGALLRAVQAMPQLRGHRVGICLRYMAEARRGKLDPAAAADPSSSLSTDERRATVQVVGRRSKVAPELELGPMPPAQALQPRYRGVAVCGSGWVCPMCAARITEGRRLELARACDRHRAAGGLVLLVTQTFSHGRSDNLGDAWKALGRARQRFARSSAIKKFRERVGFVGRIACREVTYGVNGWHPHAHELVLTAGGLTDELVAELERELAREWQACCAAVGLSCSLEHGFKLSLTAAATYVAKWGLDAELTKWQIKRARVSDAPGEAGLSGLSPFDLLRVYAGELVPGAVLVLGSVGDETLRARAAHLFAEYAEAVIGTAQLHWSRGLKALLEVDELTDKELAERDESDEHLLGTLTAHEWWVLVHRRNQLEFLGLVAAQGWEAARVFLEYWVADYDRYSAKLVSRRLREQRARRDLVGGRFRNRRKASGQQQRRA